jgi:hypothetical protein
VTAKLPLYFFEIVLRKVGHAFFHIDITSSI